MKHNDDLRLKQAEQYAFEVMEKRNRAFRILYDTVLEVEGAEDEKILSILCCNLRKISQAEWAAFAIHDPQRARLTLAALDSGSSCALDTAYVGSEAPIRPGHIEDFKGAQVKNCVNHKRCLVEFFPEAFVFENHEKKEGKCYRLSCIREDEVIAIGAVEMPPGKKLKMKDMVDTYLNLAGVILQRMIAVSALRANEEHLEELVAKRTLDLERSNAKLLQEILERKLVEKALRESEEKFKAIGVSANDAIIMMDGNGRISFWNEAAESMFGYSRGETIGKDLHKIIVPGHSYREFQKGFLKFAKTGKGALIGHTVECTAIHKNRKELSLELSLSAIKLKNEWNAIGIMRDITERKQFVAELESAKNLAESANIAKSEFLANMSHELRTPLNHIIGFTELVVDKKFGDLNDIQEEYLQDVLHSSGHLLSLINDILDLSKVEAGKVELHLSEVELTPLLENSMVMFKEKCFKHGINMILNIGDVPEMIIADERKLKQAIYNLLSNAVKFTPEGGEIRFAIQKTAFTKTPGRRINDPKDLRIIGDIVNGDNGISQNSMLGIGFSVSDTGIGLSKENIHIIFEPFEQVDGSASRKHQGTGLGLPLTKKMIELHGGQVWVKSEGEGKGSTFGFVIPV